MKERVLGVYVVEDGSVDCHVVAYNAVHALRTAVVASAGYWDDHDDDMAEFGLVATRLPDEKTLRIDLEDGKGVRELPCGTWAKEQGRGLLCFSEY